MKHATRATDTAEVFTPRSLVRDMLSRLPSSVWFDPNKTWLEPAAGDGNFLVEVKARLIQAGHLERHVLNHQLFSIELLDDNHYVLQLRLGYLQELDGFLVPGPALEDDIDLFSVSKIDSLTQDLNNFSPYAGKIVLLNGEPYTLKLDEVYHHVNHVCTSGLTYDMSFGRTPDSFIEVCSVLDERDLGPWPDTVNPEIGEPTVVSTMQATWHIPSQQRKAVQQIDPPVLKSLAKDGKNPINPVPVPAPHKPPKIDSNGGWQVKAEWIGKGIKIRSKSPYDGTYWECDHDTLVVRINASLRAKGKPCIGEPGPSEKSYGASSGLREQEIWSRVP